MFTVQMSEDEYRILGPDGEEGRCVEYGEVATLKIEDAIYYADLEEEEEAPKVYCVQTVKAMPTAGEAVDFDDDGEEDEEGEADGPVLVEATTPAAPELVE